jgi:hypothetical protein
MAISFPFDLLASFPGTSPEFELVLRQEFSRQANGVTRAKDFGQPLWRGLWTSTVLSPNTLDFWRARLDVLDGAINTFLGYSLSRCYPIAHPRGAWPTGGAFSGVGTIGSVGANRKSVSLAGFPEGFVLSVGDMIRIGANDLHRVVEGRTVTTLGNTSLFEIRPHLWPGVAAGAAISVVKPHCIMQVEPGSISASADAATGRGTISFRGIEVR